LGGGDEANNSGPNSGLLRSSQNHTGPKVPNVLVVVNTHERNYGTRVEMIRETWGKRMIEKKSMELMCIGSQYSAGDPEILTSSCTEGYREDSCKRAHINTMVYNFLRTPAGERFNWVQFVDDDVYLLPDNLQRMIQELATTGEGSPIVHAINACIHEACRGICGGGGYLMNRRAVFTVEEGRNRTAFSSLRKEIDQYDEPCGRCGDLAIARIMADRNITIRSYPHEAFVWKFDESKSPNGLDESLRRTNPPPWLYHYPARGKMEYIFEKSAEYGSNKQLND